MSKKAVEKEMFDGQACARALDYLFAEGHVYELRVLGAGPERRHIYSGYYNNPVEMWQAAGSNSGKAEGIYLVLNPVQPRLIDRSRNRLVSRFRGGDMTLNEEVLERHWLMVDFDPIRPRGISSSDQEHEAALTRAMDGIDYLTERKCPWRMLLADSGNGAHILVNWKRPNDETGEAICSAFLRALDVKFSDEKVKVDICTYNANRLCKMYGTLAMKGEQSKENPHRIARLLEEINGDKRTPIT